MNAEGAADVVLVTVAGAGALLAGLATLGLALSWLDTGAPAPRGIPRQTPVSKEIEVMPTLAPPRPSSTPPIQVPMAPYRGIPFTPTPLPFTPTPAPFTPTPEPASPPDDRLAAIEALLAGSPLAPYAGRMLEAADAAGIDWRLIPTIAVLESSAGRAACGGNAWGYASCRVTFASFDEGIAVVAATLAGPMYAGSPVGVQLCVWVSGRPCETDHGREYRDRALRLFRELDR